MCCVSCCCLMSARVQVLFWPVCLFVASLPLGGAFLAPLFCTVCSANKISCILSSSYQVFIYHIDPCRKWLIFPLKTARIHFVNMDDQDSVTIIPEMLQKSLWEHHQLVRLLSRLCLTLAKFQMLKSLSTLTGEFCWFAEVADQVAEQTSLLRQQTTCK